MQQRNMQKYVHIIDTTSMGTHRDRARQKKIRGANYKLEGSNFFLLLFVLNIYKGGAFFCRNRGPCQPPLPPSLGTQMYKTRQK